MSWLRGQPFLGSGNRRRGESSGQPPTPPCETGKSQLEGLPVGRSREPELLKASAAQSQLNIIKQNE